MVQIFRARRLASGDAMATWVLACGKCGSKFTHSQISDRALTDYFLPAKPALASEGSEFECPIAETRQSIQPSIFGIKPDFSFAEN
jgi:hypothetical protein